MDRWLPILCKWFCGGGLRVFASIFLGFNVQKLDRLVGRVSNAWVAVNPRVGVTSPKSTLCCIFIS
jgi:hypothetical protein